MISDDELAVHDKLTEWDEAATPVPVRLVEEGEFDALLANVAVPVAEPAPVGVNVTTKFTLFPEAMVTGSVRPVTVNSEPLVPLTLAPVTFTLPPEAVKVPVAVPLEPTVTLPTATGFGPTLNEPAATATDDPESVIFNVGFEAFDVTATFPVKLPADCGANPTVNDVLCPDVKVTGSVIPETLNPVPLAATCVTFTLVPPVFLMVCVCEELCPTVTFVNVRLVGIAVISPAATAVPDNGTTSEEFEAFDVTVTLPLELVVDVGVNVTLNEVLAPAAKVTGVVIPETLKPVPLAATLEILTLVPPVFLMVSVCVEGVPTEIFENVMLVGVAVTVAGPTPEPFIVMSTVSDDPLTVSESVP